MYERAAHEHTNKRTRGSTRSFISVPAWAPKTTCHRASKFELRLALRVLNCACAVMRMNTQITIKLIPLNSPCNYCSHKRIKTLKVSSIKKLND